MVRRNATEEFQAPPRVSFEDAWQFIVKVGLAAHRYGSTAGRLESFLAGLSKKLDYEGYGQSILNANWTENTLNVSGRIDR